MHNNIYRKVESYLDGRLGRWTRLLPWRHELSDHLQQEYENKLTATDDQETAWQNALEAFGDIDEVSTELKRLHKPENVCVRLVAVFIAIGLVAWSTPAGLFAFVDIPSAMLLLSPLAIGICSLLFSRGLKLRDINRYCNFALCAGSITGLLIMLSFSSSPSCVGTGVGVAILCSLYAVLFLDIGSKSLGFYTIIPIAAMVFILLWFTHDNAASFELKLRYIETYIETYLRGLAIITVAGLLVGWARWGIKRLPQFMLQVAVGTMIIYDVTMLQNISSPEKFLTNIVVSLLPLVILPVLGKILARCFTVSIS